MMGLQRPLGAVGQRTLQVLVHVDRLARLGVQVMWWMFVAPLKGKGLRWRSAIEQMVRIGFDSVPIVSVILFFVGLIMAMQSAYQLERFGATIFVADLVAVSITRELGPLLTAIIIAGRSGSAIAAEIGTMKVAEEIDAMQTMGFNPVKFLVVPRTLAMMIMLPCLVLIADLVGIFGGYLIGAFSLDLSTIRYYKETADALVLKDLVSGLVKTEVFALIIAAIGCYEGFMVEGGAEGVGKSTTASVVVSIFLIIAADVFFTALFYSTF